MRRHLAVLDNVVALLLRQLVTWTFTGVLILFLPRYLGDAGLGKITFAISVVSILVIFTNLGTSTFTVKRVAVEPERLREIFWNAILLRLAMAVPLAALLALAALVLRADAEMRTVLFVAAGILIVMSVDQAQQAAAQGLEKMRWLAAAEVLNKATVACVGVALLVLGYGVVVYALVVLLGYTIGLVTNAAFLSRLPLGRPSVSLNACRALVRGGWPFFLAAAVTHAYHWIDVTTLGLMTGDAVVGWYGAALQLYATVNVVPLVMTTALLPTLTRLHVHGEDDLRPMARLSVIVIIMAGMPIALGTAVLAGDIIHLLHYPASFHNSIPLLTILALSLPVTGILMMTGTAAYAVEQQGRWVRAMAIATAINFVLNLALIPIFDRYYGNGAIGAATATLAAEVIQLALGLRLMPAGVIDRSVLVAAAKATAAAGLMAGAVAGLRALADPGSLALVGAGVLAYAAALFLVRGVTVQQARQGIEVWLEARRLGEGEQRDLRIPARPDTTEVSYESQPTA